MISRRPRLFIVVFFLSILLVGKSYAQNSQPPSPPRPSFPHNPGETEPEDQVDRNMESVRLKKANQARQAQIKHDTDKLLILATQLKEYVDKTNADILSIDVIKKADEIEKLAHSVKEKMKE